MGHLPPGLRSATDETLVADAIASNAPGGPWHTAYIFHQALTTGRAPDRFTLRGLVTPESLAAWGNFREARELLAGTTLTTRAHSPADGVAYVTYITPPAQGIVLTAPTVILARAVASLQFRPDLGDCWRVHAIGGYLRPGELPPLPST